MLLITTGPALIADTASAAQSGTDTIPSGGAKIYEFEYSGTISLKYSVKVLSGPEVDVIVTDQAGMDQYTDPFKMMTYIASYSKLATRDASFSNNINGGHYYIIIDNSERGVANPNGQPVKVSYSFDSKAASLPKPITNPTSGNSFDWSSLLIIVIAVGAVLLGVLFVVGITRSKPNTPAPRRWRAPQQQVAPTVLVCPYCSTGIRPGAKFCERCGNRL